MSDDRRPPLSQPSHPSREDLLIRAAEYRAMAETATTEDIRDALVRVAEAFEDRAGGK